MTGEAIHMGLNGGRGGIHVGFRLSLHHSTIPHKLHSMATKPSNTASINTPQGIIPHHPSTGAPFHPPLPNPKPNTPIPASRFNIPHPCGAPYFLAAAFFATLAAAGALDNFGDALASCDT
jgi:hypothetical protein